MFRFHWKSAKLETNGILQCSLSIPSSVKVHIVNEIRKRRLVKRFKVSKLTDGDGIAAKLTFLRKHSHFQREFCIRIERITQRNHVNL